MLLMSSPHGPPLRHVVHQEIPELAVLLPQFGTRRTLDLPHRLLHARQVIPAEPQERITIPREELLHALRRAEIMTSDKSNSVKLTFAPNQVLITANTPEVGEGRESIAVNYKGKDFAVAFNPQYLMDPLKNLESDEIFLELTDELSPGVIKVSSPFLYVLMPMRMS